MTPNPSADQESRVSGRWSEVTIGRVEEAEPFYVPAEQVDEYETETYVPLSELQRVEARLQAVEEALREIVAVENSRVKCVRHGGEVGADDPDTCWCSVALDAEEKMREIARAALSTQPQDTRAAGEKP